MSDIQVSIDENVESQVSQVLNICNPHNPQNMHGITDNPRTRLMYTVQVSNYD